jgi:hypothetical protein
MADVNDGAEPTGGFDRRRVLKGAAAVGAGLWAAPVVTSLTSPASAGTEGSPEPPGGDFPRPSSCPIVLTEEATVTATVDFVVACNSLGFGLESPNTVAVCTGCSGGESQVVGTFPAGTELVFYLNDPADCCGCPRRYLCDDTQNARVTQTGPSTYRIEFRDNGCSCSDGSNISEGTNLQATITLS